MALEISINTGLINGLLPDGTKPFPEPVLTCHPRDPLAFILGWCLNTQDIGPQDVFQIYAFEMTATSPRGQWVKPSDSGVIIFLEN